MKNMLREERPVQYSTGGTRALHFDCEPHQNCFRPHWHDRMELIRVQEGKMRVEIGGQMGEVTAGEVLILSPGTLHRGYTEGYSVRYDVLMLDVRSFYNETQICRDYLTAVFDGRAGFHTVTSDVQIVACFDTICENDEHSTLGIISKIYELFHLLFQNALSEYRTQPKNAAVQHIVDFLEDNYAQEVSIAVLCDRFGYTAAHLCRKFKAATGLTPMGYLKIYRLEQASKMIGSDAVGIGEIAARCGFSDANYFTRCFKSHFGVPPTKYRA